MAAWVSEIPDDGLFHQTLLNESVLIYRNVTSLCGSGLVTPMADESKILSYWWHTDPGWRKKTATLHYDAPYMLIVDNLLDFSHLSYVHSNTIGTRSNATTRASVDRSRVA